ncbi:urease accessory protein UreD 2 [Oceanisphaera marina]|uniref:Urease accessory protein UreD n=1 Tax=Oceanisphaera marina TaxID=2017550 RepID=A0ABQ1IK20_9GAMM|nr:urease accessory protein UreD [Oceanisphaera marina]GGB43270.1 urease accessory protein UreD 2 [Oceanisphaera marina]
MESQINSQAEQTYGYGSDRSWLARLQLKLEADSSGHTRLKNLEFEGPLRIQRPFYPEGGVCHLYLLHPPGGIVSGDKLSISAFGTSGSQSLLTTPSAGKIYGRDSDGVVQGQSVRLHVENGAECEWLPQETIVYRGANAVLDTQVELTGSARFIGWDLVCLGRPAAGEVFDSGRLDQHIRVWRDGRLQLNERLQLEGNSALRTSRAGLNNNNVFGTLLAVGEQWNSALLDALRSRLAAPDFTVTERLGVLLVRYLGDDMNRCRDGMWQAWGLIRPELMARPACIPRIWLT